ncbi:hypothetical protein ASC77_15915 [Nocardioides sp. Root1257]|uniref:DUF4185 domain-containing protein n=1 Tax=unclassified Nocardioides TaxID=2615069 RepID=UPI0006F240E2|nr:MULTISPECIES: DUF4185 domain-containing protein [unclassified Nocardioides]KQW47897.1 hypothetical protein ASC77_15915 [Nocardioides sp. Root1257]KRC45149.1 hypothetical protein ASE24_16865 [Nocardioides sp. Root224]
MASKERARRWTVVACLVVIVVQAVALATLTLRGGERAPHHVPLLIAGPAVVAESLAGEAGSMPGEPFDATWTDDEDEARAAILDGTVVAAVLVDLRTTQDVVLVNARADHALNDAVVESIASVERAHDRTVTVEELAKEGADGAAGRVRMHVLLLGAVGFGFVLLISLVRGPVASSARLGVLRVVALAGVSVAGAALLQVVPATRLPGDDLAIIGLGALYAFSLGALALAVEALAGLVGLTAAAASYFVLATPLLAGTSHHLLPPPWSRVTPWMPIGAAQEALGTVAYFDPGRAVQPALVVAAAGLLAVLALVLARQLRFHDLGVGSPAAKAVPVRHWRLWVVGSVLPLAVLLGLAIAFVPTDVVEAASLPSVATETSCVDRGGRPRDVAELNHQIATLQGSPAFQGGDVGADVQLADGRFLVVFGDTLRSADFDGPRFARNSMMLWDTDCVSVVLPPSHGALIPDRVDGVGYWPMSTAVAHRPGYDLVLVSAQRVKATGGGSFDFANLGPALAVFVVAEGQTPQLIKVEDIGADDSKRSRPEWGAAMAVDDDWLYLYGTANPDKEGVFGFSLRVARVRPEDVLESSKWRFWDGSHWQRTPSRSAELLPAVGGVSQTLSVFPSGKRWYALSKRDGDLGDQMVFWTAPAPTGPFTPTDPVASLPADPDSGAVTYMPLAHPQIFPEAGTMVASYSNNNTDPQKIKADPTLYRPTFLRVPLPR